MQRSLKPKQSDKFENILLHTQHGDEVRFYDDLVKDKAIMVNLMFTTCPKICPANSARLSQIIDYLDPWIGSDIHLLSLTIDPEIDTPEKLKTYWQAFGSKPGWTFLTGDYDEIDQLRRALGVYDLDPVVDADKLQHSGILTFGNDRTNRWAALPILMEPKQLVNTVLRTTWDDTWKRVSTRHKKEPQDQYKGIGIVKAINSANKQVKIEHEAIVGLMPAMTMYFNVQNENLLEDLTINQKVTFTVEEQNNNYIIRELH